MVPIWAQIMILKIDSQTFKNIWEHFLFYSDHEISSYMTMSMFQLV